MGTCFILLPANDSVLKALFAVPQRCGREAVRTMILARQRASRATARQFRLFLYLASLALVGLLVYVGIRLQSRARALQPRRLRARACRHLDALYRRRTHGPRCAYGRCTRRHGKMCWCRPRVFSDRGLVSANLQMAWASRGLFARLARWRGVAAGPRVSVIRWHRSCSTHQRLAPRGPEGCPRRSRPAGWACVLRGSADGGSVLLGLDTVTHAYPIARTRNSACYGWRLIRGQRARPASP